MVISIKPKKTSTQVKKPLKPSSKTKIDNQGKCTGWKAWEDRIPSKPVTLYVTGKCRFPAHGYKVRLKKATPQGTNPAILLLEKVVHAPSGPVIQVPEVVEVNYRERVRVGAFKQVTILPEGKTIRVKKVNQVMLHQV